MKIKKIKRLEDLKNCNKGEVIQKGIFGKKELIFYTTPHITTLRRQKDKGIDICWYLGIGKDENREKITRKYNPVTERIYEKDGSFSYYNNALKNAGL